MDGMYPRRSLLLVAFLLGAPSLALAQSLGPPPVPPENPITEPKRVLGKALFWDEQLSSDNTVACGTCHIPSAGGSDPRIDMGSRHPGLDGVYGGDDDLFASAGVRHTEPGGSLVGDALFGFEAQVTGRRSPSNIGAAYFDDLFWDGRATSMFTDPQTGLVAIPSGGALESQSLGPILSFVEMADTGRTWNDVVTKLAAVEPLALATDLTPDLVAALAIDPDYPALFTAAFGDPAITSERIAFSLATYQRTLVPDQTPWDRYQNGDTGALNPQQISGMNSFFSTSLKCSECHQPPLFSDGSYRNIGLRDIAEDDGRRGFTGVHDDRGKFKVPSLRNASLRTRYFHNGDPTFDTLFVAVFLYNQGAGFFPENKDPLLGGVNFSPGTAGNMTEFIRVGLLDPRVAAELPPFDRPTLRSELGPAATLVGRSRAGSGGFRPQIHAYCPPLTGNGEFRVGVSGGLGGAAAILGLRSAAPGSGGGGTVGGVTNLAVPTRIVYQTVLDGMLAGDGHATWHSSIPADPALIGTDLWFRWLVRDAGAGVGTAASRWARLTVF